MIYTPISFEVIENYSHPYGNIKRRFVHKSAHTPPNKLVYGYKCNRKIRSFLDDDGQRRVKAANIEKVRTKPIIDILLRSLWLPFTGHTKNRHEPAVAPTQKVFRQFIPA
jgi:hypothetical protein